MNNTKPELVTDFVESEQPQRQRKPAPEKVLIFRLPNFDDDSRTDQQAAREYIAEFPANSEYERAIRQLYGSGHYRIETRRGGKFVAVHELHIEDPPPRPIVVEVEQPDVEDADLDDRIADAVAVALAAERNAQAERGERAAAQVRVESPALRPIDPVRDALRLLKEFKELSAELMPAPVTSAPVEASGTLTTEKALLHLIAQDEGALDGVRSKLLNTERGEGWAETIRTAVKTVSSDLPGILALLGVTGQKPAQVAHPKPHAPRAVAPPVPSEQIEAGDEGDEGDAMSYEEILQQLFVNLATNEPPMESVGMFRELVSANPEYAPMIAGMMYLPIDDLMTQVQKLPALAATEQIPHAKKWFEGLQKALRDGAP